MIAPDGKSPTFDGASWVSQDGRYWWNGAAWQPVKRRAHPPLAVGGVVLIIVAVALYLATHLPTTTTASRIGQSNSKIVSAREVTFDYRFAKSCSDITFNYVFFDSGGNQVDALFDETHSSVSADRTYHYDAYDYGQPIDPKAVRFTANPVCHG